MDNKKVKDDAPVKPFDDSIWDRWSMYDNMPYVWDTDLSYYNRYALESGNVIKASRCLMKEPYEVKN